MGVKFQAHPRDQDSQIILHVRMLDAENALQQEALGIVGVNLLYGAFFLDHEPEQLIESLLDNLTTGRIEIDMIEFSGIDFRHVDNRVMSLKLVQLGLSDAAMSRPRRRRCCSRPRCCTRRPILVERGSFRPVDARQPRHARARAQAKFVATSDPTWPASRSCTLMEITMRNLRAGRRRGEIDRRTSWPAPTCWPPAA